MSDTYVSMASYGLPNRPVYVGVMRTEKVATGASAVLAALVANPGDVASVFCATAIIVRVDGTATQTAGIYCPAGVSRDLAMPSGGRVSIIDAI